MDSDERQDSIAVELADMAQDRPVAPATWFRPPVVRLEPLAANGAPPPDLLESGRSRQREEQLIWQTFDAQARRGQRAMHSGPGMLEGFLALADGPAERTGASLGGLAAGGPMAAPSKRRVPAERILAFAQRWGVLGLCEHHLPSGHPKPPAPDSAPPGISYCMPAGWWNRSWNEPPICSEPVWAWRRYATRMRAARNIAAQLHRGRPGRPEDWEELRSAALGPPGRGVGERVALAAELDRWLTVAGVRPVFMWTDREPRVSLEGAGLVGALVVQLMLAIARTGLAICTGCANAYVPRRRPRPDVANYCPECQKKGAALDAAGARYRQAKREARELKQGEGLPAGDIAKKLGREVAVIRRWLAR
jgi:hypothetical protein